MEGNFRQGSVIRGGVSSYGGFDLQNSTRVHNPDFMNQHRHNPKSRLVQEYLPFTMTTGQTCDHHNLSITEQHKGEKEKNSVSEEDEPSFTEEGDKSTKGFPWQRVKWTDKMVKLLITAVSYIADDSCMDSSSSRRKFAVLQKKEKWKSISKVIAERNYHVSPQQCEDKFNDLNKRYKKLNEMLGRGTSCQVVENPALLDSIRYLNSKEKEEVRKIMSSKHLFYEEMCSYNNGNRLHLPHDLSLQRSLQLALRNRDDLDDGFDDGFEGSLKNIRKGSQGYCHGDSDIPSHVMEKKWIQSVELEEKKVQIQVELLELEKQRFRWRRFSKKRDEELERLRIENEKMKLENDRMGLELNQRELGVEL